MNTRMRNFRVTLLSPIMLLALVRVNANQAHKRGTSDAV